MKLITLQTVDLIGAPIERDVFVSVGQRGLLDGHEVAIWRELAGKKCEFIFTAELDDPIKCIRPVTELVILDEDIPGLVRLTAMYNQTSKTPVELDLVLAGPVYDSTQPIAGALWNGEACKAIPCQIRIGDDKQQFPLYWARHLVGFWRNALMIEQGGHTWFLDDEDGSGHHKITAGKGMMTYMHRSLNAGAIKFYTRTDEPA